MSKIVDYWDIEYVKNILNNKPEYNPCFKHVECRGMSKCLGLVTVYWNRLLDWLCTI